MLYTIHATSATLGQELTQYVDEVTKQPQSSRETDQAEERAKGYAIVLNQTEHLGATDWVGSIKAIELVLY